MYFTMWMVSHFIVDSCIYFVADNSVDYHIVDGSVLHCGWWGISLLMVVHQIVDGSVLHCG